MALYKRALLGEDIIGVFSICSFHVMTCEFYIRLHFPGENTRQAGKNSCEFYVASSEARQGSNSHPPDKNSHPPKFYVSRARCNCELE